MIEEATRLLTPTNNMWRIATEDTELDGVKIPKGSVLIIRYGSGNRDEDVFENPDKFDVTRKNARRHIAFGPVSYTHLTLPTICMCRSRWSPYH